MNEFNKIEKKWQNLWEEKKTFKTRSSKKKKFYNLEMFPYPSGLGLHMGHARTYCIGDCYARFKRLQGFNVLYPMGYDAFGLPAENAAIKEKTHPKIYTENAIKNFRKQLTELGLSYDWDKSLATCYPDYYKWNQWFFLKFYEKGLAYRKKAPINWCPKDQTVLANEQVIDGKCWRCETKVEVKQLEQWFFKITDYAEELLKDIKKLDWPEKIKLMQENWIGKSEGTLAKFKLKDSNEYLEIFTTRIDTLFSVTFLVMAPEHPKVLELVKGTSYESKAKEFINKIVLTEKFTRTAEDKEKEGFFTGRYAINPATNKEIPIYLANFVVMDYGTGVVMANAHDERDVEFSKKYNIPLIQVLKHKDNSDLDKDEVYTDYGILKNSDQFNNLKSEEAIPKIQSWLQSKNLGKKTIQYKIRDWLISRQRYWGTPIPIVYCDKCGIVTVSEKQLPVLLPENVKFTGEGNPLLNSDKFVNVKCPKCKSKARRETDTMDTFVDSSWYFLRYTSNKEKKAPFKKEAVKHWLPVDTYIGGAEHAVLHLLYARFFTKVLRDMKLLSFDEPFLRLFSQGTVTKNNVRMSKSHGNVVSQDEIVNKYGIDTARLYLLFVSSPDKDLEWNDEGAEGAFRFINKFYSLYNEKHSPISNLKDKF
ncbi:MAG TPA: leucine--tRNA ligase, partial [Candidatus Nanoarchaeia archaeon]|nr:leucine--tRNA ligase [Candidatus Nanoarchaeia archaeon]